MAEQAIETIYALGKYPDVLCNDFVKNLTRRAFGRQPTTLAEREQEQGEKEPDEHASYWLEGDRSRNRYLLPSTRRRRLLADHHKVHTSPQSFASFINTTHWLNTGL